MREFKRPPTHPGEIIKSHYLERLGMTVSGLAQRLEVSRKTVSKVVNGRGAVIPDMALRLSRAFGTTPELWMNLQRSHDLWHACRRGHAWRHIRAIPRIHSQTSHIAIVAEKRSRYGRAE
jgi:addiction module HigA family antidote